MAPADEPLPQLLNPKVSSYITQIWYGREYGDSCNGGNVSGPVIFLKTLYRMEVHVWLSNMYI